MEQKQNINDFIMLHLRYPDNKELIIRINDIKTVIQEEYSTYISMREEGMYHNVKESATEIFKMINK